jgi:hypothetical protein
MIKVRQDSRARKRGEPWRESNPLTRRTRFRYPVASRRSATQHTPSNHLGRPRRGFQKKPTPFPSQTQQRQPEGKKNGLGGDLGLDPTVVSPGAISSNLHRQGVVAKHIAIICTFATDFCDTKPGGILSHLGLLQKSCL